MKGSNELVITQEQMSNPNPYAFPVPIAVTPAGDVVPTYDPGMSMRQYYKAAALMGCLAADRESAWPDRALVRHCSSIADDMLAEDKEHNIERLQSVKAELENSIAEDEKEETQ